jgi:hypothetical protein
MSSEMHSIKGMEENTYINMPQQDIILPSPKKIIPTQKIGFDEFYKEFEFVKDLMSADAWAETWSHYYSFGRDEQEINIQEPFEEINNYRPDRQVQEIIKCVNSFPYFAHKYFKITHPTKGMVPFILFNYQRRVINDYHSHRFNICSKFRQGGLTTVSVAWAVWKCLFQTDQQIMLMSKTDREAISAGEVARRGIEELPTWMKPQVGKFNEHERQFKDTGSTLWFYTPEAARGKSITVLIIDEAAFIQDMHKHWKAMYPVIATGGACCVVSTVNGIGNWYHDMYSQAEAGKNAFNVIDLDYWEHPEYNNPTWIKDTKSNLGEKGWQQEVLRSFLGSGDTYIAPKVLAALDEATRNNPPVRTAFDKWSNKETETKPDWGNGALWFWKEPLDGHEYIMGIDCAEGVGTEGDNSCFQIIDVATLEQVAEFYSNTVPPHIFAQIINEVAYYYNVALVVVESNTGGAVANSLQHDLSYENLYYTPTGKQNVAGIKMSKTNRPVFLESLQNKLINNTLKINSIRLVAELNTFIYNTNSRRAEAQKSKHDDAIFAMCIAVSIRDSQMRNIPIGAEVPKELTQVFTSQVYEEIKQEILKGSPEDWLEDENRDPILLPDQKDVLPGVIFENDPRPNAKILREFGW